MGGWSGGGGVIIFAAHQDQPCILNNAKCFMRSSTTSNLSGVFFPPPSSLCTFSSLYLFEAENIWIVLSMGWEAEANVAVDWNHKLFFYFTAVYLFALESRFVSFFCLFDFF